MHPLTHNFNDHIPLRFEMNSIHLPVFRPSVFTRLIIFINLILYFHQITSKHVTKNVTFCDTTFYIKTVKLL